MNISNRERSVAGAFGRIALALLVAVAALTSAVNDLNHLGQLATSGGIFAAGWLSEGLVTASARSVAVPDNSCVETTANRLIRNDEFRWNGRVNAGKAIEIKGINGDINAEPAAGDEIEVVANKKGRNSDPDTVNIQVVEHSGGVTICALYPSDDPDRSAECVPGSTIPRRHHNARVNIADNDVRVDFTIRVPAGVEFQERTVNGEITAKSLVSNVESRIVNGSINISTTGYAQAKNINGEVSATLGNSDGPGALEFRTLNGEISLTLPSTLSTDVQADASGGVCHSASL